jgi:metal-sulfur cluster biosynthetic enzyme
MASVLELPTIHSGLPAQMKTHISGGRDQWSQPLSEAPSDPTAAVRACLGEVLDPEIPISLIDLGLIYGVRYDDGAVEIDLTFTATACPCMEFIREDITDRLLAESWIRTVHLEEVWEPAWTRDCISDRGREQLRALGVGT